MLRLWAASRAPIDRCTAALILSVATTPCALTLLDLRAGPPRIGVG